MPVFHRFSCKRSRSPAGRRRRLGEAGALLALSLVLSLALGCGGSGAPGSAHGTLKTELIAHYADIVHANYSDAHRLAVELRQKIDALVADPSPAALLAARRAWLIAREPYGQTEAYRFYGGAVDRPGGPETQLNAWPVDEAYIDYVEGAPQSGIVNAVERYPDLDAALLAGLNEQGAEENISVGFHAIEFLLWGQDRDPLGPGDRPYTDYVEGVGPNAGRRARYLALCAEMLVGHLQNLKVEWAPGRTDNYRAEFLALPPDEALVKILTGIGVLSQSEMAGERLFTAYDNQDQEDEHSCFSDNTHRDMVNNAAGLYNVYIGTYQSQGGARLSGPGLHRLLTAFDAELGGQVLAQLEAAVAAVAAIPAPFDQAIVQPESRPLVLEAVRALQRLGRLFAEAAGRLGLKINTALPA